MTRGELDAIFEDVRTTKGPSSINLRVLMQTLNCYQRTENNKRYINTILEKNQITKLDERDWSNLDDTVLLRYKYKIFSGTFKLYHLEVLEYNNLKHLDLDFEDTSNYCSLIGLNGSGKSNVIEAISYIFYNLYQNATIVGKKFQCPFKYRIVYSLHGKVYEITNDKLQPNNEKVTLDILPKNVIASYSGEDTRLWEKSFRVIFDRYCGKLTSESAGFTPPFMFYISKRQWDISMLSLIYSEDVDAVKFIQSIRGDQEITISFDYSKSNMHKWEGTLTGAFIDELKKKSSYTAQEFRDFVNTIHFIDSASTLFYLLYKATINGEMNLIRKIGINFQNGYDLGKLSEGEKKMILANTIVHILASDNTLCLFDEPDSHIHISKKEDLIKLIDDNNRYSILTTHSPAFIQMMNDVNIKYLEDGAVKPTDALKLISKVSDNRINLISGALLMSAQKPLILVEGIGDVDYIKKAINIFKTTDIKYRDIDWDVLQMGGAANAKYFITEIKPHINASKQVIVIFDRDTAGADAMKELCGSGNRESFDTYKKDNWHYLMLPKTSGHTHIDFLIEDYFPQALKNAIAINKVNEANGCFNKYPKDLKENVKAGIKNGLHSYTEVELAGFSVLLDKLLAIVNGSEAITPIP